MTKKLKQLLERVETSQRTAWGATLGELLDLYLHVFSQRKDIRQNSTLRASSPQSSKLSSLVDQLPPTMLSLHHKRKITGFQWQVWKDGEDDDVEELYGLGRGGLMLVQPHALAWEERDDDFNPRGFSSFAVFDRCTGDDYGTIIARYKDQDPRELKWFYGQYYGCDETSLQLTTVEEYITQGAKQGFAIYWQDGGAGWSTPTKLHAASLPRDTPQERLTELLTSRGCTADQANALIRWLQEDTVILFHHSA